MYGAEQSLAKVATLGGAGNSPEMPRERGRIEQHLNELHEVIEHAHNRLSTLEGRLAPVLRPSGPAGASEGRKEDVASPCAEILRGQVQGVAVLVARMNDLISRLDT